MSGRPFDRLIAGDNIGMCDACERLTPIALLDAKPDNPAAPDTCDWNRVECAACYGPGFAFLHADTPTQVNEGDR